MAVKHKKDREKQYTKRKVREHLEGAVKRTFEDMAFLDITAVKGTNNISYGQVLYINILDPVNGAIGLYMPAGCKKKIIENIYSGEFESLKANEIDDCLLEMLNVLTGSFLNSLLGEKKKYNIDFPKVLFDESEVNIHSRGCMEFYFTAEEERFKVRIALKEK